jgi:RNA polymerase sigma factor (TIGR02999 family)
MSEVTRILSEIEQGDPVASEKLLPLVYNELRQLAAAQLADERPGQTLQATALVHDAYIRLVEVEKAQHWNSRGHFFAAAAEAMRRILVERARRRERVRHGGQLQRQDAAEAELVADERLADMLKVDAALDALAEQDPRAAELVKLRFFVGMTNTEAAASLQVSTKTIERTWVYAKAWLREALSR